MTGFSPKVFAGRRYAVLGLGRNGLPAARALVAMGAEVAAWDDRPDAREAAGDVRVVDLSAAPMRYDALVLSPGIPHLLPAPHPVAAAARAAGVPILSDAELLYQAVRRENTGARFVGITGTNGKSTTTALLAHMLQRSGRPAVAGGNLGDAALGLPRLGQGGVYVLEMSSYMLERLATLRFDAAAMLNLSPDHLDRHGSMQGYVAAKAHIFDRQQATDLAVVGVDDPDSRALFETLKGAPAQLVAITGAAFPLRRGAALPGEHNAQNAAAATAIARWLGLSDRDIEAALLDYPGLPHRQEQVGEIDGVLFVNDSKATNADAAARALGCYERLIWIAGGIGKEGGIEPLVPYFPRMAHAILIGRDGPIFAGTLSRHGVSNTVAETLDAAVPMALQSARESGTGVVLLSPAAASFDQFSGFDARGTRFAQAVAALRSGGAR